MLGKRFLLVATLALSTLPFSAWAALESAGRGSYEVKGSATGGIPVSGAGTFSVKEQNGQVVFRANVGKDLDMGIRDDHTNKEFGIKDESELTVTVASSSLKLPTSGAVEAKAPAKINFRGVSQDVTIAYKAKRESGGYVAESASFSFDYTRFRVDKKDDDKKICRMMICVKPQVEIILKPGSLRLEVR